ESAALEPQALLPALSGPSEVDAPASPGVIEPAVSEAQATLADAQATHQDESAAAAAETIVAEEAQPEHQEPAGVSAGPGARPAPPRPRPVQPGDIESSILAAIAQAVDVLVEDRSTDAAPA